MRIATRPFPLFDLRAVDGDTIECWCGISAEIRQLWRVRLKGIEGGELDTEPGLAAWHALKQFLQTQPTHGYHFVGLETVKDQHGRHVGDILTPTGHMLTSALYETGFFWRRPRRRCPSTTQPCIRPKSPSAI